MKKVCNSIKLAEYMKQNNIDSFFSNDMQPYMELIFLKRMSLFVEKMKK